MDVSILIIHYGDPELTKKCLKSVYNSDLKGVNYEIFILDNTPKKDHSSDFANYKNLNYIITGKNNYAYALNFGTKKSKAKYIVFLNPDISAHKSWLKELIATADRNKKTGGVMSKILFNDKKTINTIGITKGKDYYFKDVGLNKKDNENLKEQKIDGACGCCVLYKKKALEEVNGLDEDFVMYYEDVDLGYRLREKGWDIILNPKSIIYHALHGTSKNENLLPWYFCNRNRMLFLAKRFPEEFPKQIKNTDAFIHKKYDALLQFIHDGIFKLFKEQNESTIKEILPKVFNEIKHLYGLDELQQIINELSVAYDLRKPKICIYDHAMHIPGGGQKYGLTIAEGLQNKFDVTLVANKKTNIGKLEKMYGLDLKKCKLKIIDIPFYKNTLWIDERLAENQRFNPFAEVDHEVLKHDMLINVNMNPHVNALTSKSIMICHFPMGQKKNHFFVKNYDRLIANSEYTQAWINKLWNIKTDTIVTPPIDMKFRGEVKKENIILSVARFEPGGSKKQIEMIKAFYDLCKKNKTIKNDWKLILAGGSLPNNDYLEEAQNLIDDTLGNVEIIENISNDDLKKLYAKSKIFWHACGLGVNEKKHPHLIEHFGMTTVEAMQNGCVPVVIDGGGQREIVKHGENGFRFSNKRQFKKYTLNLVTNEKLLIKLRKTALNSSGKYNKQDFQKKFIEIADELINEIKANENFVQEAHIALKKLKGKSK